MDPARSAPAVKRSSGSAASRLSAMFAQAMESEPQTKPRADFERGSAIISDVVAQGTISKAVDSSSTDDFHKGSFALRRTRSLGLLDEFVIPTSKLIEQEATQSTETLDSVKSLPASVPEPSQQCFTASAASTASAALPTPAPSADTSPHARALTDLPQNEFRAFPAPGTSPSDDVGFQLEQLDSDNASTRIRHLGRKKNLRRYHTDSEFNHTCTTSTSTSTSTSSSASASASASPPNSPPTGLPSAASEPHIPQDDSSLQYEPASHVDYLSHDWKESDISQSWRYVVLRRKDVANSARLENASWRTWTKAKYNLPTVAPESVNWLKDCDVTWLYGPLYREPHHISFLDDETPRPVAQPHPTHATHSPQPAVAKKPILKKRTVSEIMRSNAFIPKGSPSPTHTPRDGSATGYGFSHSESRSPNPAAPHESVHDTYSDYFRHHNYRHLPRDDYSLEDVQRKVNTQYTRADAGSHGAEAAVPAVASLSLAEPSGGAGGAGGAVSHLHQSAGRLSHSADSSGRSADSVPPKPERRIHFNDRVEQCIVIDQTSEDEAENSSDVDMYGSGSEAGDGSDSDTDSDSDEGFFLHVSSKPGPASSRGSLLSSDDGRGSSGSLGSSRYQTIAPLPATTLKSDPESDDYASEDEFSESRGSGSNALSHNTNTYRGYEYKYDYNTVYGSNGSGSGVGSAAGTNSGSADNSGNGTESGNSLYRPYSATFQMGGAQMGMDNVPLVDLNPEDLEEVDLPDGLLEADYNGVDGDDIIVDMPDFGPQGGASLSLPQSPALSHQNGYFPPTAVSLGYSGFGSQDSSRNDESSGESGRGRKLYR